MKKLPLLLGLLLSLIFTKTFSQDFLGLNTGNYSGVTGVMLQPASIVDSRYQFDINLFSTDVHYSNNYFLLDRAVMLKFNKNKFDNYNTFKNRYLSQANLGSGEKAFFNINNRTQLPLSFMATTGKKSAISLNMQFRTMIQGRNITQDFANLAFNNFYPTTNNPSVDASGMSINSLSWAEVGFTYGRVLYSSGEHFLKGAFTAKYLAGLSSISLSSDDLRMRVNSDSSFDFNSQNVSYNHNSNADFNKLFDKSFRPNANAFGFDVGLVYEFRGNLDRVKHLKSNDGVTYDANRRDLNEYLFKVGVSLLDVGMFQFDKPATVNSFGANINNWDIRNAHYNTLKEFDAALASRVVANPNDPQSYNVYLPSALSVQLDVKVVKGLYVNAMSYLPVSLGARDGQRFDKYGFYTITPRYETRYFGIYIPYTVTQRNDFTDYKQHLLGLTLRAGPLFIGSSNLGSMLFKENLRTADVHIGLKFGFTYGKRNKSNRFLRNLFKKNQEVESDWTNEPKYDYFRKQDKNKEPVQKDNRGLILDYKNGKVYDNPDVKQNLIIINNNYYYGNAPAQTKVDSVTIQRSPLKYNADSGQVKTLEMTKQRNEKLIDSIQAQNLEMTRQQNKRVTDSISKVTKDSLEIKRIQLDSLIRSMQQLKMQMDSSNERTGSINKNQASDNLIASKKLEIIEDSLRNVQDSLQKYDLYGSTIDTVSDRLTVSMPARESLNAAGDSFPDVNSNYQKTELLAKRMDTMQKGRVTTNLKEQKKSESSDIKKKNESAINPGATQNKNDAALNSSEENRTEAYKIQNDRMERNTENLQRIQEQQNQLYQKYVEQSMSLTNDIDRLNRRLATPDQNKSPSVQYVPVPLGVPYDNSGNSNKEAPPVAAPIKSTDTVYVRDTLTLYSKDTVHHNTVDTVPQIIKITETKTDTIRVQEPNKQPGFNYLGMPEDYILFGIGKSEVQSIYNHRLNFIADVLKKNPNLQVTVTGHTDATGSKAINEKLSLQRAEAVSFYLMNKGVPTKQIIVKSVASEEPAVSGSSQTARSQNRRVVVKLNEINN